MCSICFYYSRTRQHFLAQLPLPLSLSLCLSASPVLNQFELLADFSRFLVKFWWVLLAGRMRPKLLPQLKEELQCEHSSSNRQQRIHVGQGRADCLALRKASVRTCNSFVTGNLCGTEPQKTAKALLAAQLTRVPLFCQLDILNLGSCF